MSGKEAEAVPPQAKSSWMSFLKSMASFNGDLSSMTAPPFILSSTSLVEYSSYWAEHPTAFTAPANAPTAEKRALAVLKWFLTTLKQQYSSRNEKLGSEKKPLNPFLGELFLGKWSDKQGDTHLVSEQVSHHPPVTAYCIWNPTHGVRLQGYNGQKASFATTINVRQVGHSLYHIDKYDEDYLITLPSLHIEGLLSGAPYVELNKATYITSSTGYTAKIDYSGKGWISGKKNRFTATLFPTGQESRPLYTIDGQWSGEFTIKDSHKNVIDSWNHAKEPKTALQVAAVDQQDELESRRAWRHVAAALQKGDMNSTSHYKTLIEESQRALRKKEKENGKDWEQVFFVKQDTKEGERLFEKLGLTKLGESIEAEKTGGVWRFSEAKEKAASKPYRQGTLPNAVVN